MPVLKFKYCSASGYKHLYEELSRALSQKFPTLPIDAEEFDVPTWRRSLSGGLSSAKLATILSLLLGAGSATSSAGAPWPLALTGANLPQSCSILFLLGNIVETQLLATGAFEVSLSGLQIWSKLQGGRLPSASELLGIVDGHLQLRAASLPSR